MFYGQADVDRTEGIMQNATLARSTKIWWNQHDYDISKQDTFLMWQHSDIDW